MGLLILYKAGNPASEREALALAGAIKKLENITIASKRFSAARCLSGPRRYGSVA